MDTAPGRAGNCSRVAAHHTHRDAHTVVVDNASGKPKQPRQDVMAFSPTDTMPLTHRAKALMTLRALVAVSTLALVFARAVNVLR
jgi:hypothetical protein